MASSCVLGLMGYLSTAHFAQLDNLVAEQAAAKKPVSVVKCDPRCSAGIEWAMRRGHGILLERMEWTYQRNSVDDFTKMVIGLPTVPEDYATPHCEFDVCRMGNPDADDPEFAVPLSGDFLPEPEHGRLTGPKVNTLVVGGKLTAPKVEDVKIIRMW